MRPENWNGVSSTFCCYWPPKHGGPPRSQRYVVTAWWPIYPERDIETLHARLATVIATRWEAKVPASSFQPPGMMAAEFGADLEGCLGVDLTMISANAFGRWRR